MTDEEAKELIDFAAEARKRVKDQLYIIDSTFCAEPAKFEYSWLPTGELVKVETLENLENNHRCCMDQPDEVEESEPSVESHKPTNVQTNDSNDKVLEIVGTGIRRLRPRTRQLVSTTISVRENQGGVTYKGLFGDYLKDAKDIKLTDPFIRQPYQIDNLVDFIAMVREVTTQDSIRIHVSTQNEDDEKVAEVIDIFNDLSLIHI